MRHYTSEDLLQVLRNVLTQLPSFLTLLVSLVIAIARWKRHPRVSLVASLAFIFIFLHGLVFSIVYIWIPPWFFGPEGYNSNRSLFTAIALTTNFLFAISVATLLLAVFIDRTPQKAPGSLH